MMTWGLGQCLAVETRLGRVKKIRPTRGFSGVISENFSTLSRAPPRRSDLGISRVFSANFKRLTGRISARNDIIRQCELNARSREASRLGISRETPAFARVSLGRTEQVSIEKSPSDPEKFRGITTLGTGSARSRLPIGPEWCEFCVTEPENRPYFLEVTLFQNEATPNSNPESVGPNHVAKN